MSEQIWKEEAETIKAFSQLLVIIRNALAPSPGETLQSQAQDSILDGNYGETIAKHFPRINIKVRDIPFVDSKRLRNLEKFPSDDYANVVSSLASDLRRFPLKKTIHGANMDGAMIASFAKWLEIVLNQNSWSGFSNAYTALETELCDRSYQNIIEPFLRNDLSHMNGTERTKITDKLDEVIAQKEEMAETERRLDEERRRKEEEEKMEREREEQRRREAREKEKRLEEERRARAKAEEERRIQEEKLRRAEEERRSLEEADEKEESDIAKAIFGGALLLGILSDSRLKENITVVPHSDFEQIGVRSYNWVWSKDAVDLGMRRTGHGVIAQEVEELYPLTVVTGDDGYKRVDYEGLKQMVMEKKTDY